MQEKVLKKTKEETSIGSDLQLRNERWRTVTGEGSFKMVHSIKQQAWYRRKKQMPRFHFHATKW